jgi:hypothetical protein
MGTTNICGAVLGKMVVGGVETPMVCGKPKGHPEKDGHTPAAPTTPTGVPSDAVLKAFGAGIPRPVTVPGPQSQPQPGLRRRYAAQKKG